MARKIYRVLESAVLGALDDKSLEAAIVNFNAFRKVAEEFELLRAELSKRLYGDIDRKSEEEKAVFQKFFEQIRNAEKADAEERAALDALIKKDYPELYELRRKELITTISLLNKEVEIEVEKIKSEELIKCILKGKEDASIGEIYKMLSPMFEADEKKEAVSGEIDKLLK